MKKIALDYYIQFHTAEASGNVSSLSSITNYTFFNQLKKKVASQQRTGYTIIWNHNTPKPKLTVLRYLKFPVGDKVFLQVGVEMHSKQVRI